MRPCFGMGQSDQRADSGKALCSETRGWWSEGGWWVRPQARAQCSRDRADCDGEGQCPEQGPYRQGLLQVQGGQLAQGQHEVASHHLQR